MLAARIVWSRLRVRLALAMLKQGQRILDAEERRWGLNQLPTR